MQYGGAPYRRWIGYSGRADARSPRRAAGHAPRRRPCRRRRVAVSRAAAEAAGLLDEELFLYVEDVDWSLRIRARRVRASSTSRTPSSVTREAPRAAGGARRRTSTTTRATRSSCSSGTRGCRAVSRRCAAASSSARTLAQTVSTRRAVTRCAPSSTAGATHARDAWVREARRRPRRSRGPCAPTRTRQRVRGRAAPTARDRRAPRARRPRSPRVARVEEPRGVADRLGQRGRVRARHRAAARHRLERRQSEALVERREDERRRTLHQRGDLGPRDVAARLDSRRDVGEVAAAREDEPQLGTRFANARERREEPLVVLVRPAPRRIEEERLARAGAGCQARVVDAERHDPDARRRRARAARSPARARTR